MPENVVRIRIETQGGSEAAAAAEHSAGRIKGALGGIGEGLSFGAGFEIARKGVDVLTDAFKGMFEAASSQAQIVAQTEAAIKSTGGAAGLTAEQIGDMADSLTKVTTFSDDTIQSGENLLLTFTSIGKDVFPQATKTMLDMSQALGQDVKSSAIQLGKALNDPIQGMTALQRVGVSFTAEQKAQVKAMQESGNVIGAQKLILAELTKEFGGSAEAAGKTFPGQLKILGNELGLLQEKIGTQLLGVLAEVGKVAIPLLVQGFDLVGRGVERLSAVLGPAFAAIQAAFSAGGLRGGLAEIGNQLGRLAGLIGEGLSQVPGLVLRAFRAIPWAEIGAALLAGGRAVMGGLVRLWTSELHIAADIGAWLRTQVQAINWSAVWAGVRNVGAGLLAGLSQVGDLAAQLTQWLGAQVARIDWGAVWGQIKGAAEGLRNALSGLDVGAALGVLTQQIAELGDTVSSKLGGDKPGIAKTLFDSLGQNASGALSATVSLVGQLGDQFQKLLASRELAGFMDSLNAAWAAMQQSVAPLTDILQTLGGVLGGVLLVATGGVLAAFRELEPVVSAALVPAFTLLSGVIDAAGIVIRTFAAEVRDTLQLIDDLIHGKWSAAWEDAKNIVGDALAGAEALVTSWTSHVLAAFGELVTGVGGALLSLSADVQGKLGELAAAGLAKIGEWTAGMLTAIGQFELDALSSLARWVGDAASKVGELPGQAKAALGDVSSLLVSAGEDLIGGFIQGIKNKATSIPGAVKDAVGSAISAATGVLGIGSPSKVFAAIGADTMAGFAQGVQANTDTVQQAVGDAAAQIVAWARQYAAQHGLDPVALAAMEVAINQYEVGGSTSNPFQFMNTLAAQYGQGGTPGQQLDVLAGMGRVNAAYRAFVAAGGGAAGLRAAENIQEIPGDAAIVARGQAALSQAAAVGQAAAASLSLGGTPVSQGNPVPVAVVQGASTGPGPGEGGGAGGPMGELTRVAASLRERFANLGDGPGSVAEAQQRLTQLGGAVDRTSEALAGPARSLTPASQGAGEALDTLSEAVGHQHATVSVLDEAEAVASKHVAALGVAAQSAAAAVAQAVGTPGTAPNPFAPGPDTSGQLPKGAGLGQGVVGVAWGPNGPFNVFTPVGASGQKTIGQQGLQFFGPPPPNGVNPNVPWPSGGGPDAVAASAPSTTTANIFLDSTLIASASVTQYGRHRALNVRMK